MKPEPHEIVIGVKGVMRATSLSRTSIWRLARSPSSGFPRPIQLGPNRIGWLTSEIEEWLATRPRTVPSE